MMEQRVKVAVPAPFFHALDYLSAGFPVKPGCRVQVPLGRRQVIGLAISEVQDIAPDGLRCRPITACLDEAPTLSADILKLCAWTADYFQHPIGEVIAAAMPIGLRKLTAGGKPRKARVGPQRSPAAYAVPVESRVLRDGQRAILAALAAQAAGFSVNLVQGVTGSGKTEIYLQRTQAWVERGGQVLVLTPEIGLTPQLAERFRERFGEQVGVFHSGMTDRARTEAWCAARDGRLRVLIGTRSAVFTPMPELALIVVDEEHDGSYKQQEGLRYSARDIAVLRARQSNLPVILGSATPSLESLHNAQLGRYRHFHLRERATAQPMPSIRMIDLRRATLHEGLSAPLLDAAARHLADGGQVLIFVNRRGFAPALLCHDCGWVAPCPHCDTRLTLHRGRGRLICHHCASQIRVPVRCGQCGGTQLIPVGQGTERVEEALRERFPDARVERLDSDRVARAGELERLLGEIQSGVVNIVVGTQMLAKGHDFERLSLVGVLSTDQALFSSDFRATERMGQLLTQVAGRAGRGKAVGEVLVQTHQPEHPHLRRWLDSGYEGLAATLMEERRLAGLPPFRHLALLRADALTAGAALQFLGEIKPQFENEGIDVLGPVPAPMERRANRHRAQLLLRARSRPRLQAVLGAVIPLLDQHPGARRVRWSIDVDPLDLY